MQLHVSEAAMDELRDFDIPEDRGIRIDAEISGG